MNRFTRSIRVLVASALFVSAAVLFAASPANAIGTGTMVDNGDGSMTVTWAVTGQMDSVYLIFYPSGGTCPPSPNPVGASFFILGGVNMVGVTLGPSPTLLSVGSSVKGGLPPVEMQIPAGSFVACLYGGDGVSLPSLSQSLAITFAVVAPTTTTTSTTTAPAADPVAPAFTG